MAACSHRLFSWFLLYLSVFAKISSYRIFYAEEGCRRDGTLSIWLDSGNANSSGILKASRDGRHLPDMHCRIALKSHLSSEIVISIRLIDLMPPVSCENYLELNSSSDIRVRLCGYLFDKTEIQSYFSLNDMDLIFHTQNATEISDYQTVQFEVIFTAVNSVNSTWLKKCGDEEALCENGRCIWKGLVNDGHNNCGDFSDEVTSAVSQENQLSTGTTLAVIIPIIVLSLGLILLLMCCFGHRVTAKIERLIQNEERRNEARNALISPNSTPRRQNYSTIAGRQDAVSRSNESPAARRGLSNVAAAYYGEQEGQHRFRPPLYPPERRVNTISAGQFGTVGSNDTQLPPYDPPPSYESVTEETKQKY